MDLEKKCTPCEGGVPPLKSDEIEYFMKHVDLWTVEDNKITKIFEFKDFKEGIEFVNKVADLAEDEGHHPDISINWNKIKIILWTHAINGLSENDFIMAYKIDKL